MGPAGRAWPFGLVITFSARTPGPLRFPGPRPAVRNGNVSGRPPSGQSRSACPGNQSRNRVPQPGGYRDPAAMQLAAPGLPALAPRPGGMAGNGLLIGVGGVVSSRACPSES